jgi:hypothetical protein
VITLSQYIDKLKRARADLTNADKPVFFAAQAALTTFSRRVFQRGESTSGSTFKYNDTNPLYVDPKKTFGNTSALRPPRGKHGDTKFKSGKPHKTTWVSSYKELRNIVGRESSFVNFEATGDLKSEIENRTSAGLTPRKISDADYEIRVTSDENAGKLLGLNTKYPNVFKFSESEKKEYYRVFNLEYLRLLRTKLLS